jgi:hypothetical protein
LNGTTFPHTRFIAITGTPATRSAANLTFVPDTTPGTITSDIENRLLTDTTPPSP